jgi:hypothetical protein
MYFPFKVFAFTAGLALATAAQAQTSPLDPEHFLDPQQGETSALIAQDLASAGSGSAASLEDFSQATAVALPDLGSAPAEDTAIALQEAAPAPVDDTTVVLQAAAPSAVEDTAAALDLPVPGRTVQDPETTVLATEFEIAPSQTDTTGSVAADVVAPTLAIVPVGEDGAPVARERALDETFSAVDATTDLAAPLLP